MNRDLLSVADSPSPMFNLSNHRQEDRAIQYAIHVLEERLFRRETCLTSLDDARNYLRIKLRWRAAGSVRGRVP